NELGTLVGCEVVLRNRIGVAVAASSKGCPEVADFVQTDSCFTGVCIDRVILVLQVPVAEKRHHDTQSVKLSCSLERIVIPIPGAQLLCSGALLQTHCFDFSIWADEFLSAFQSNRQILHYYLGQEVVLIRYESDGPEQSSGRCFGAGLRSQLGLPLRAGSIAHIKLRICPASIFFQEGEGFLRLILFAAGPVIKVAQSDVAGVSPQDCTGRSR